MWGYPYQSLSRAESRGFRGFSGRCSICGKRGHLQNVCTSKGPVKTTKTEKWWKKDDTDTSKGCTRCGGDKWHMKRLCPAFGHRCELCSHENHYEFMCGAKAKKAKEAKEAKAKEASGVGGCGHPWLPTYHDGGVIQHYTTNH
ncbi:unnamed protein product [Cladocopium goreaui]|uniref:CCHC-type domain-containing protein n=1 Tax=Cladocopium goreaui TaxID=2562237 RepID=A0A9P1CRB5_9DINO|nr:unnamed protein product [Cladocopium goreaui]